MKSLFLDTNIYLHYQDIEQINWKSVIATNDDITIVVPEIVIQEIDDIKDKGRDKIRSRAKKISTKFADYFLEDKQSDKFCIIECGNPCDSDFDGRNFSATKNDDIFILSMLKSGYDITSMICVSSDNTPLIKAKKNKVQIIKLPDLYKLKEELSEIEKEAQGLKKELDKYKNRTPSPIIYFKDESKILMLKKPKSRDLDFEVSEYADSLKIENPPHIRSYSHNTTPYLHQSVLNKMVSDKAIEVYNSDLDEYIEKCIEIKQNAIWDDILNERFQKIELIVGNYGTIPTGKMVIFIEYPRGVRIYNETESCDEFEYAEPNKPELKIGLDFNLQNLYNRGSLSVIDIWNPDKFLENNEVRYNVDALNHKLTRYLTDSPIFVDTYQCGNFQIKWSISDPQSIDIISGVLNVVIQRDE